MNRPGTDAPVVLVVVGTDKHPFDRLVHWVDDWVTSRKRSPVSCFVQYGTSVAPRAAQGAPYLEHDVLEDLMKQCSLVVTHGGPTTIAEARRWGHRPLVVPRRARLGEHVDDHQVRFVHRLREAGLVDVLDSAAGLSEALEAGLQAPPRPAEAPPSAVDSALAFGALVETVLQRAGRPGAPTSRHGALLRGPKSTSK